MRESRELILAFAMWAAAIVALFFGIDESMRDHHNSASLGVAIFLAVAACVPTAIAIAQHYVAREDASVERIVEVVDALHESRGELTRLR